MLLLVFYSDSCTYSSGADDGGLDNCGFSMRAELLVPSQLAFLAYMVALQLGETLIS